MNYFYRMVNGKALRTGYTSLATQYDVANKAKTETSHIGIDTDKGIYIYPLHLFKSHNEFMDLILLDKLGFPVIGLALLSNKDIVVK